MKPRMAVLGAGSFGTALAVLLARNAQRPILWGRDASRMRELASTRRNRRFLPDQPLPASLDLSDDLGAALSEASGITIAVPSDAFRAVLEGIAALDSPWPKAIVWATKGFEPERGRLLHEVAAEVLGGEVATAALSGPTFAAEVARSLPAAVTIASSEVAYAKSLAERFHSDTFRVYISDDLIGVQVGGAVKNVLAIAAGIADGLGFGANTRAALITRGLAELMRFGVALGGRRETFMGLAGLGDLVLTCTDDQSRNRRAGLIIGRGGSVEAAQREVGQVIEGIGAARAVMRAARRLEVEMPIAEQVERVLHAGVDARDAVSALLGRAAAHREL